MTHSPPPARRRSLRVRFATCIGAWALVSTTLLVLAPATARGQELESAPPPSAGQLVRVAGPPAIHAAPGATVEVAIPFEVMAGWHINAHRPNEDFLIPTGITIGTQGGLTPGAARYPAARQVTLSFSDTPLAVYEGRTTIVVPITVAADAAPGERALTGTLRFQACNDQVCLPPMTVPVRLAVIVSGGAGVVSASGAPEPAEPASPPVDSSAATPDSIAGFETAPPADGGAAAAAAAAGADNLVGNWFQERGTLLAFLFIFLMGLALNLTPCVYPMMGVTVSLFGGGAGSTAAGAGGNFRALPRAIIYVLGIAFMYSTLGVVAAMTGGLFGGWLASPWVLGGIGVLLLGMALSMFGLYELQMPSSLLSKLGGATGAGYVGTFLAGLLVGVFAAPCIGPPIIALLAHVGAKGDPVWGFQAFFVLSLGLGLPYLVLAVFSGLLTRLPRSGSWMDWVKHLFGVILLGVAAFYLTLAFAPHSVGWVVPAALGLGGLYLGFLEPTGRDRIVFRRFKWAVGVAGIVAAALIAFRPAAPAITWEPFSETALGAARTAGRPVVLDFSAEWCVPCHELEEFTFTDSEVVRATAGFVRLKVDLTRFDSPESQELRERFAIAGVPTIVFLDPAGHEVESARVVGFMRAGPFLERVDRARAPSRP